MEEKDINKSQQQKTGMDQPIAENPNPRANENIRIRTDEPENIQSGTDNEIGSEITDGEDA